MSREKRAAVSGRRQTETREEAAGVESEHEGASRGNVSTIGEEESARSAEGRKSASIIGKVLVQGLRVGGAFASTIGKGAGARSARGMMMMVMRGGASASTIG